MSYSDSPGLLLIDKSIFKRDRLVTDKEKSVRLRTGVRSTSRTLAP